MFVTSLWAKGKWFPSRFGDTDETNEDTMGCALAFGIN